MEGILRFPELALRSGLCLGIKRPTNVQPHVLRDVRIAGFAGSSESQTGFEMGEERQARTCRCSTALTRHPCSNTVVPAQVLNSSAATVPRS